MKLRAKSFRGEAPRITPRALPDNAAQEAINARLQSGDLEAWRQFTLAKTLANAGTVRSFALLDDAWISFEGDVDIARGVVPGDTTFRTYLTGGSFAQPRWTNKALATTGSEPYPVTTRPLGVPNPESAPTAVPGVDTTPTAFSIDVFDPGDQLTQWQVSPEQPGSNFASIVVQSGPFAYVSGAYNVTIENNFGAPAYAWRGVGLTGAAVQRMAVDFQIPPAQGDDGIVVEAGLGISSVGAGFFAGLAGGIGGPALLIYNSTIWGTRSELARVGLGSALTRGVWYTLEITKTRNTDGSFTVRATVFAGSAQLNTLGTTGAFTDGEGVAIVGVKGDDVSITAYDNFVIQASGATGYNPVNIATSYVFTYVNDIGEESGPSLPSATILRPDGVAVTIGTPTVLPTGVSSDYGITTKRIYRAATGATGSIFRFVAEIPLATAEYVDVLNDEQLGEALESEGWELPPDDLRGILALPNGIMCGFRRNQLCLSAQNRPHAWPVANRLTTDTDIVGIGAIDTSVVIGTESFPYLAQGQTPESYGMVKFEIPQACVAKRSFATLGGIGVVFASPDGYLAVSGVGQIRNLTDTIFTRKQWQALDPTSIIAAAHDDVLHFFCAGSYGSGQIPSGYALDMKPTGFGLIRLGYHATAAFADPITDTLYLVLDDYDEPGSPYLPGGAGPTPSGQRVFAFDSDDLALMPYRWRGKLNILPRPMAPIYCRVEAEDYDSLMLRGYGTDQNGRDLHFEVVVTDPQPFTLPVADAFQRYELEVVGTSRVRGVHVAEDITELDEAD